MSSPESRSCHSTLLSHAETFDFRHAWFGRLFLTRLENTLSLGLLERIKSNLSKSTHRHLSCQSQIIKFIRNFSVNKLSHRCRRRCHLTKWSPCRHLLGSLLDEGIFTENDGCIDFLWRVGSSWHTWLVCWVINLMITFHGLPLFNKDHKTYSGRQVESLLYESCPLLLKSLHVEFVHGSKETSYSKWARSILGYELVT